MSEAIKHRYSDDARRLADNASMVLVVTKASGEIDRRWMSVKLLDGSSDGEMYYSREDAVRHTRIPWLSIFILVPPTGISYQEAEDLLAVWRRASKAGWSTESEKTLIMPRTNEGIADHVKRLGRY